MRALLLTLALLTTTTTLAAEPAKTKAAPEFTLNAQDGKPVSLKDLRGKWVVLYFYPKDFTSGCTLEAHNFQRDLAQYEKANAVVVGVSTQDEKSHAEFCVKESLSFKLLADTKGLVAKKYDAASDMLVTVFAKRMTFLIDPQGTIARSYVDVDPASHSAQVLKDLAALQPPPAPAK